MTPCWICESQDSVEVLPSTISGELRSEDFRISDSHYGRTARIVKCRKCGFRYADPLPAQDLVAFYSDLNDPDYDEGREGRLDNFRRILDTALRLRPQAKTLLDIGAGTGLLCLAAREKGLRPTGVEPSAWAVKTARKRYELKLFLGVFPQAALAGRRFDIVTLVDVIEHVADPVGLLRSISEALAPQGIAVVVTPDVSSIAAKLMGRRWWHYRVAHVCYFSPSTMQAAAGRAGLRIEYLERYSWSFSAGYLAERLERYLPVRRLRTLVANTSIGKRLLDMTIRVNLRDSHTFCVSKS